MNQLKKRKAGEKNTAIFVSSMLLFSLLLILMISELFLPPDVKENSINAQVLTENEYLTEYEPDGSRIFRFSGEQICEAGGTLAFYSSHQEIEVLADEVPVYSVYAAKTFLGKTPGGRWNFIAIPEGSRIVTVHTMPVYAGNAKDEFTFTVGNGNSILSELLRKTAFSGFLSMFNVILGICMIVLWLITNTKTSIEKSLLYLGQFAVIIGLWSLGETDFSVLIFQNRALMSFFAFLYLALMPFPFILFARDFMRVEKDRFWYVLFSGAIINLTVCTGLQLLQIKDFKETVFFTHIILIASFLYMCHCLWVSLRSKNMLERVKVHVYGMIILGLSVAADLISYYVGSNQVDSVGRIGFNIYILLLGAESAKETMGRLEEGLKAEYYRKVAITDNLTGIYNRTAFDKELRENSKKHHAAVMFDMNDLKYVNDTYGHAAGDMYISQTSIIIQKVFSDFGPLYRIGGDEFCCISAEMSKEAFDKAEAAIRKLEAEYNAASEQIRIHIACGFAANENDGEDKDINDLIKLADQRMYDNKRLMKEAKQKTEDSVSA